MGIQLWDLHVPRLGPAPPKTAAEQSSDWQLALRKADRDLRLAEGLGEMPFWLRALFGVDSLERTIEVSRSRFEKLMNAPYLREEGRMGLAEESEGAYALAVLTALSEDASPAAGPFRSYGLAGPPAEKEVTARIIEAREQWWDLAYLRALKRSEFDDYARLSSTRTGRLVGLTLKSRGVVIAVAFGGLVFVPGTLLAFLRARSKGSRFNYAERWKASFGVGVFLLAYLASYGFTMTLNQGLALAADPSASGGVLSMPAYIALDSLTRFLPALIGLGMLFRRTRHAVDRLGIAGPFDGKLVLGCFAILQVMDFGLRVGFDRYSIEDPTGGLTLSETGGWGLVLGIVSACLAAPIAEEILYRGILFRSLANRFSIFSAAVLSSAVFSLVHGVSITSLLMIGMVGWMASYTFVASRTLLTAIVLHALYNASVKIPEWIVYQVPLF